MEGMILRRTDLWMNLSLALSRKACIRITCLMDMAKKCLKIIISIRDSLVVMFLMVKDALKTRIKAAGFMEYF